jgi:hypothetical protein
MKRFWQFLIFGLLVSAVPTIVSAQSLGINFGANDPDTATSALLPGDVAGVVPQANWNNLDGAVGSNAAPLVYDNGTGTAVTSTVSVSWNTTNTWRSGGNNAFANVGDRVLMSGYLDIDVIPQLITVTVDNIDAALRTPSYDVYVYFLGDSTANRGGGYTLTPAGGAPIVKYGSTMAAPTMHVEDPGTDINNSVDGTYLRFSGVGGTSFTLVSDQALSNPDGTRAPINGIQIVKSTLTPGDVNGDGLANITDFHIIRANLFNTNQTRAQGDLVTDGVVDFADYREWKLRAGAGAASSAALSVPEPSSWLLLAVCGALAAMAERRSERRIPRTAA